MCQFTPYSPVLHLPAGAPGGPLTHPVVLYTLVLGSLTIIFCLLITLSATRMFIIFWLSINI